MAHRGYGAALRAEDIKDTYAIISCGKLGKGFYAHIVWKFTHSLFMHVYTLLLVVSGPYHHGLFCMLI